MVAETQNAGSLREKRAALDDILSEMDSVVVAYSGGADSALLAATAHRALGSRALSVTARSPSLAPSELRDAVESASRMGLNHRVIDTAEVERDDYRTNGPNRCYFCKDELYAHLGRVAREGGYAWVANGANGDDLGDLRPGLNAARRHGVRSPMVEAGLAKDDVRAIAREMGLPTWDKPAQACLSSRIPYGTPVSAEALSRIGRAEDFLRGLGFKQLRVRHHDTVARIEVDPSEMPLLLSGDVKGAVTAHFRSIGYAYVTLDLDGFRSGSLNEVLAGPRPGPADR